jgi:hypothetical protein
MGLPTHASDFLNANFCRSRQCSTCGQSVASPHPPEQIGTYLGMFDQEYPLYRYTLIDGRKAEEFHQTTEFSSGPVMFLGLRVGEIVLEWSEEEIRECL